MNESNTVSTLSTDKFFLDKQVLKGKLRMIYNFAFKITQVDTFEWHFMVNSHVTI